MEEPWEVVGSLVGAWVRGWWQVVRSEERGAHHDERGAASARVEPDACVLVLAGRKVDALLCRERHAARAWVRVGARDLPVGHKRTLAYSGSGVTMTPALEKTSGIHRRYVSL